MVRLWGYVFKHKSVISTGTCFNENEIKDVFERIREAMGYDQTCTVPIFRWVIRHMLMHAFGAKIRLIELYVDPKFEGFIVLFEVSDEADTINGLRIFG